MTQPNSPATRRDFLKTSAAVTAGVAATTFACPSSVYAGGNDVIKVGLIGCGGRGTGAAENVLHSAKGVELIAVGDYFQDNASGCRNHLTSFAAKDETVKSLGNKVDVPEDRCYSGLDAYQKVINAPGVNYIILATPPGFRPVHLQAAVAAGKNVFTEKPVGVDGAGIRTCLEVYEEAAKKKLGVGAGTQRRHQAPYIETIKQLHDGAIGDIVAGRAYWNNTNDIWFRSRRSGMTDLDYQIHNWYHFCWLCGDHIVEQHVHNLDVLNWVLGAHPLRALGMGSRVRPCSDPNVDGHIYNFFAVEYEYPKGIRVESMCRQMNHVDGNFPGISGVSEAVVGTKGACQVDKYRINDKPVVSRQQDKKNPNPYVQEHTDLIESIRAGKPINELKNVAESTLTAIMGRMSAYTGKVVSWEQALNSKEHLMPDRLDRSISMQVSPVPIPGKTPLV
jgi:myo-inositol 2-dehydrogenase / D-chiro-inositol 1-dehydrogenase